MINVPIFQGGGAFLGAIIGWVIRVQTGVPEGCIWEPTLTGARYFCGRVGSLSSWVEVDAAAAVVLGGVIGGLVGQCVKWLAGRWT
jgi:hypothetical protein